MFVFLTLIKYARGVHVFTKVTFTSLWRHNRVVSWWTGLLLFYILFC